MQVTVSVIIPTYNRAHMLGRALASVFAQTMSQFELIVVDDASQDDTPELLESFRDPRLRCIRHSSRMGASAARNSGLRECRGSYVAFLDSDDEWFPTKLVRQLDVFGCSSVRTGLVYTGLVNLYPDARFRVKTPRHRGTITRDLLIDNVVGSTSVGMVRRDVFDVVGEFDEDLGALQDADLWLRISRHFEIDFAPDVLVRIHMHAGDERISYDPHRKMAARDAFYAKHGDLFKLERVAHRHHAKSAWICLRRAGSPEQSRSFSRRAIRANRTSPLGYLTYAATFVPGSVLTALGAGRRAARRSLAGANGLRKNAAQSFVRASSLIGIRRGVRIWRQ